MIRRGTRGERALAYAGIALWVLLGVDAFVSRQPILLALDIMCAIIGVREIKQWQAGKRYGRWPLLYAGKPIYPRVAWFATGILPGAFTAIVITGMAVGPAALEELSLPAAIGAFGIGELPAPAAIGAVGAVAGGSAMQCLMVARAKRRNDDVAPTAFSRVPPLPLPPPPRHDPG